MRHAGGLAHLGRVGAVHHKRAAATAGGLIAVGDERDDDSVVTGKLDIDLPENHGERR